MYNMHMFSLIVLGHGPALGSVLAAAFYKLMKVLHYEDVAGNQDKSGDEEDGSNVRTAESEA
jgi:hypothetical protein